MIYVLSDIHGNKKNFDAILKKINLQPEDSLYILGDVIDRHPYGIQILQQIMKMPNAHMLLGNHEWMMMNALGMSYSGLQDIEGSEVVCENRWEELNLWYRNSGQVTHDAWNKLSAKEQEELGNFLSNLPLEHNVEAGDRKFKLVHAAPVELYQKYPTSEYENIIEYAVWDRELYKYRIKADYTIVFGHTPTSHLQEKDPLEIWDGGDMIGIDCGSGFPKFMPWFSMKGRLACLRLDDKKVFYSDLTSVAAVLDCLTDERI